MVALIDVIGQSFGKLKVIGRNKGSWECRCDCGNITNVSGPNLRSGRQKSCGCLNLERITIHGESTRKRKTSEYKTWSSMKDRCYIPSSSYYSIYGGRGIVVCERWLHSFENFLQDMGRRPSPNHSLDRINVNGNYEPSNCRWATGSEQIINQRIRSDNTSGHKGVSFDKRRNKWHAYLNIEGQKRINLGNFKELSDAIEAREQAEIRYHNRQPS